MLLELGSIIGLVAGLIFVITSILISAGFNIGVAIDAFIDAPSIMIVFGGSIAATFIAYPFGKTLNSFKAFGNILKAPKVNPSETIGRITHLANIARKEGILSLEEVAKDMNDEFLQKGIMLIVDGTDPELVRNILDTELSYLERRHSEVRSTWEFIGGVAPAWGMMGTFIGLILMLRDLSDPDAIGPSMAIALITSFYGALFANYIALPVANKMKGNSAEEMLIKEVLIEGILSIQAGENPRIIEEKLKAFLSPALRSGNAGNNEAGE